jgi:type I restriction enzyme S subunit
LGEIFRNRRERSQDNLPILSVTMGSGLVRRDTLDRKNETSLESDEHLLVQTGDIAYNMMRMWQGAFGLAEEDGVVSPAYVVLAPTAKIDSLFASYLFKTPRMLHLFWSYSYGLTDDRLRLYFKDFAEIKIRLPRRIEQVRIGKILAACDRHIQMVTERIRASRCLKAGLMQRLLVGTAREDVAPWPMEPVLLGELFAERIEVDRCDLPLLSITAERGVVPRSSDEYAVGADLRQYKRIAVDDIGYNTMRMWQGVSALSEREGIVSPAYTICVPGNRIDGRFAAYMLKHRPVINQLFRYSQGLVDDTRNLKYRHFAEVPVAIPSLANQRQVAEDLSLVDRDTILFERYRDALLCQKRALMQRLLSMPMPESR